MRWDAIQDPLWDLLEANAALVAIIPTDDMLLEGEPGEREFTVPSLRVTVVSDTRQELWQPILVQVNPFTRSYADLVTVEAQLLKEWHREVSITLSNGIKIWMQLDESGPLDGPVDGVWSRPLTFRFTTPRPDLG